MLIHQIHDAVESREVSLQPSRRGLTVPSPVTFELVTRPLTMKPGASPLCCPDCRVPLDLHQPDEEEPAQLLGICDDCSKWYFLVEMEADWNGTLLFELPSAETIREMLTAKTAH
jgi:hypothetical protein